MNISLGVKTDPIEYRYSYEWLFDLMAGVGVRHIQLGSFFEMYFLDPDWFVRLREQAQSRGLRIKSMFTSHRELGGLLSGDPALEQVTKKCYPIMLDAAAALGVDYAGSNLGAVHRDRLDYKAEGMRRALWFHQEMMHLAKAKGLKALTIEPMSCLAEPPTTPAECNAVMAQLDSYHRAHQDDTVPVYFCGDISHGCADASGAVVHDNWSCFQDQIPHMCEFHFKNTDRIFNSTFGFNHEEVERGIVKLDRLYALLHDNADRFPVAEVTGYLEMNHIKLGRDYTDGKLGSELKASLAALSRFNTPDQTRRPPPA